jgi:hypothetical protein
MGFMPTDNKNKAGYNDPVIRQLVWLKENTYRTELETKVLFARDLYTMLNRPGPMGLNPIDAIRLERLVEAAVYLKRMLLGQAAADEEVRKINAAAFRGVTQGTADRKEWEAGRPW